MVIIDKLERKQLYDLVMNHCNNAYAQEDGTKFANEILIAFLSSCFTWHTFMFLLI